MKRLLFVLLATVGINTSGCSQKKFVDMDVAAFEKLIGNKSVQVLDVRTAEEFAEGHLLRAVNVDVLASGFEGKATELLDKKRPVAIYCRSGRRSTNAAKILTKSGYRVTNLRGGILAWQGARKPVVTAER